MRAVTRYELEHGWMDVAERSPHPALRPHVRRYWGFLEKSAAPVRRREIPGRDIVMVLSFGPSLLIDEARRTSFVAGLSHASVVTEHDGESNGIEVNFTPLGARMILGIPMHLVANDVVPFADAWGDGAAELLEQLHEAREWEARFHLLDAVLAARLARAIAPPPAVDWAWRRLLREHGRIPVGDLARELACSRRYLAVQFREHVGLTPKLTARVLRFQLASRLLGSRGADLDRVAFACGYYDQAHFNRDFREFAGSTPTEFIARIHPTAPGLAAE